MNLPHNALIAVIDGTKLLLFRNAGDEAILSLEVAHVAEQETHPQRALGTDEPGRTFTSGGTGSARSAYENTDFHEEAKVNFGADAVDLLNSLAVQGWYEALVVIAPPKMLGAMRGRYHKQLEAKLIAEVPKDLAHATTPDIEAALQKQDA